MTGNDRDVTPTPGSVAEDPAPFDRDGVSQSDNELLDAFWASKTEEQRAEFEAAIDEAIKDVEENGGVPHEEAVAWLQSLDTDSPLPMPQPRKDFSR